MNGYEKRAEVKRKTIIESAKKLFFQYGISDVTVKEIAEAANVSPVTIFKYFLNKENLAREAMIDYTEESFIQAKAIIEQNIPFKEKLSILLNTKKHVVFEMNQEFLNQFAWEDPVLKELYHEIVLVKQLPLYKTFFEQGIAEGVITDQVDSETIIQYILMSIPLYTSKEFIETSKKFKMGVINLFCYGLFKE